MELEKKISIKAIEENFEKNLYKILPTFLKTYFEWIQQSKLNLFHGLYKFNKLDYVHGTTQCSDFFFLKHKLLN